MIIQPIIPTVFRPPTLEPLVDHLRDQGLDPWVIEGEFTNHAWNQGIRKARVKGGIDAVLILNDDIAFVGRAWLRRLQVHLQSATHVSMVERAHHRSTRPSVPLRLQDPKGHAFGMLLEPEIPAIPSDLKVMHGDDWIYQWHRALGTSVMAQDIEIRTGAAVGFPQGGYSSSNPRLKEVMGMSIEEIAIADHAAARHWFVHRAEGAPQTAMARRRGFLGTPMALSDAGIAQGDAVR